MLIRRLLRRAPPSFFRLPFHYRSHADFLIFKDQRWTRAQVAQGIRQLASGLTTLGLKPGDRLAVMLPACPEAVMAVFLNSAIPTIIVPLNPLLGEYELRHILNDCGASAIIVPQSWMGRDFVALLRRLLPQTPALRRVIVNHLEAGDGDVFWGFSEVLALGQKPLRPVKAAADIVLLIYTSGTTGLPKGVALSRSAAMSLLSPRTLLSGQAGALDCLLLPLSFHHLAALWGLTAGLWLGKRVVLTDQLDPHGLLAAIEREGVTRIGATATLFRLLLATPGQERYDLSSVQRLTFASEPVSAEIAEAVAERFRCPLLNYYGATETGLISWSQPGDPWQQVAETVGKAAPGVRIRIAALADGRPLGVEQNGEVRIKSSQVMAGYYNNPALTAQAFDAEGWFGTGDLGHVDGRGYLHLHGRKDDLIIRAGQNIHPAEIERFLEQHPAVLRAGVIGVRDGLQTEAVQAFIKLRPAAALTAADLHFYCRGQLAPHQIPARFHFLDALPLTETGKLQRYRLRQLAEQVNPHDPAAP